VSPHINADRPSLQQSEGRGVFQRYVAIGTSISMGAQSDGVDSVTQKSSWPAQLARMGNREITQPYIQLPGCHSPIAPPLGLGVRLSGEQTLANPATLSCAPLVDGVTLPTQNVAIFGARASDALSTTPQNVLDPANGPLYSRVLAAGQTQVSAMEAETPKLVSVELGANEVLNARSGVALVGPPPFPIENPATFAEQYHEILDRIAAAEVKHVAARGTARKPVSDSRIPERCGDRGKCDGTPRRVQCRGGPGLRHDGRAEPDVRAAQARAGDAGGAPGTPG
jgi:hypothetical protein